MRFSEYKIGMKEYFALTALVIATSVSDDIPSILFKTTENAAWMQPIISTVFILGPLYLLMKVINQYEDLDMFEIINKVLGTYIGTFILFILWMMLSIRIIVVGAVYTNIVETMFYPNTPTVIGFIVLLAVSGYVASKGVVHISSLAWVFLISIKITFVIALLLGARHGSFNFLFPLFGPGGKVIIKESFLKSSIYLDFIYLAFLLPYLKSRKIFTKGSWAALFFITIELSIALIAFLVTFDYQTAILQNYPYHELLRFIHIGFLTNMESFFFPFWLIASFIRFGFYFFMNLLFIEKIFSIKKPNLLLPSLITLFIIIGIYPQIPSYSLYNYKIHLLNISTFVMLLLPCLLALFSMFKGGKINDKKNK